MIDLDGSLQERPTSDEGEMQSDQEQSENQPKIKPKRYTLTFYPPLQIKIQTNCYI